MGAEPRFQVSRQAAVVEVTAHRPWPLPAEPWVMAQTWHDLLFCHWRLPVEALRPHVPAELELETFDGSGWLGVTPFLLDGLRLRNLPPVPLLSRFLEVNLRTYVRAGGRPGIWFFSLDAASRLAVEGARATTVCRTSMRVRPRTPLPRRHPPSAVAAASWGGRDPSEHDAAGFAQRRGRAAPAPRRAAGRPLLAPARGALMPLPDGFLYQPGFLAEEEEARPLEILQGLEFEAVVMHGRAARRTARHHGLGYDYDRRGALGVAARDPAGARAALLDHVPEPATKLAS
jgi:hypothetical protein